MPSSKESSQTQGSNRGPCTAGGFLPSEPPGKPVPPKLGSQRESCNQFLKCRCLSELSWNFLKTTNAQVLLSFSRGPGVFLLSSLCKKLEYVMICFYLVCFTFSISYSMLPFHSVYALQFLHLALSFFWWFSSSLHQV